MSEKRQPASLILKQAVSESTAHGISRVVSSKRDVKLRVFWLVAFLAFLAPLLNSCISYVGRLRNPIVKSVYEAEKVPFEFPDLYFCNTQQAAAFTYRLNKTELETVANPLKEAQVLFSDTLKSMHLSDKDINVTLRELMAHSAIQSLPYSVLADIVGQRRQQSFYLNYGIFSVGSDISKNKPVAIETLYHPSHLKCFRIALTDSERAKMIDTNNRMQLTVLLDPYFFDFDKAGMYNPAESRIPNLPLNATALRYLYPFDWNLNDPFAVDRGSGMYLYLVPRGQYPSKLTSQVVILGPGRAHDVAIRMQDSLFVPADFNGKCVDWDQLQPVERTVQFLDPHSGSAQPFSYSEAHCYYTEMAREAQRRYNCSLTPQPTSWEFRHLSLCFNLTAASWSVDELQRRVRLGVAARDQGLVGVADSNANWDTVCAAKRLCQHRSYSVTSSFGVWPNQGSLIRQVDHIFSSLMDRVNTDDFRSLLAGVTIMKALKRNSSEDVLGFEDGISRFFKRAAFTVTLRAEASFSSLTTFSLDYGLPKFIADIGSALGLYLGCSLLTVLEIAEMLHDLACFSSFRSSKRLLKTAEPAGSDV